MARIRSKNTKPELAVRSLVHRLGFRFRLHRKDLPGCPDIVLPKFKAVIFVHGCFWHFHNCSDGKIPETNKKYWKQKLFGNMKKDQKHVKALRGKDWKVLVVWECEVRKCYRRLPNRITKLLLG